MIMKKKSIIEILALALILSALTGCGNKNYIVTDKSEIAAQEIAQTEKVEMSSESHIIDESFEIEATEDITENETEEIAVTEIIKTETVKHEENLTEITENANPLAEIPSYTYNDMNTTIDACLAAVAEQFGPGDYYISPKTGLVFDMSLNFVGILEGSPSEMAGVFYGHRKIINKKLDINSQKDYYNIK